MSRSKKLKKSLMRVAGLVILTAGLAALLPSCGGGGVGSSNHFFDEIPNLMTGSVEGTVIAPVGSAPVRILKTSVPLLSGYEPLEGASVNILCGNITESATTDSNGYFFIKDLYEGQCNVSISKSGYETLEATIIVIRDKTIDIGDSTSLSIFPSLSGVLQINTNVPGAYVVLDGVQSNILMENTSTVLSSVSQGEHTVSLSSISGFTPIVEKTVSVEKGSTSSIELFHIPKNNKIYFESERDSDFSGDPMGWEMVIKIYRMNPDGTDQERITPEGIDVGGSKPSISVGGDRLVYGAEDEETGTGQVHIVNSDGTGIEQLTNTTRTASWGRFSYDGKFVLYTSFVKEEGDCEGILPYSDIFIMDIVSKVSTQLTDECSIDIKPSMSPDGEKIVFTSLVSPSERANIYVMNKDGSGLTQLTSNGGDYPVFSPDGHNIAYTSSETGFIDIYIMDANGNNKQNITNNEFFDKQPSFSPDGTQLAFSSNRFDDGDPEARINYEICVINIDGTGL